MTTTKSHAAADVISAAKARRAVLDTEIRALGETVYGVPVKSYSLSLDEYSANLQSGYVAVVLEEPIFQKNPYLPSMEVPMSAIGLELSELDKDSEPWRLAVLITEEGVLQQVLHLYGAL